MVVRRYIEFASTVRRGVSLMTCLGLKLHGARNNRQLVARVSAPPQVLRNGQIECRSEGVAREIANNKSAGHSSERSFRAFERDAFATFSRISIPVPL